MNSVLCLTAYFGNIAVDLLLTVMIIAAILVFGHLIVIGFKSSTKALFETEAKLRIIGFFGTLIMGLFLIIFVFIVTATIAMLWSSFANLLK